MAEAGAADHCEVLARFLRVWKDALDWVHKAENRAEALELVAAEEKLDEKAARRKLGQSPRDGRLNITGLHTVLELRVQFGLTPAMGKDLQSYVDESFYRRALGQ